MNFYLLSSTHWQKIMRITFSQLLIALILSGVSFAKNLEAQDVLKRPVNITVANSTLENTLKKLEKDASVKFVYSKNIVRTEQKITFAATGLDLKDVLDKLLTPNGILYRVISDHIVLNVDQQYLDVRKAEAEKVAALESSINVFTVKGKVSDESGPLPGVNITLKGSSATGTTTDVNGNYTLNIPDGTGTLVFSFIGYATQEIAVGGRSSVNVTLIPNTKSLNEVVVIGYGTQKRGNVTGAVATMRNDNLDERAISRVDQALVGQLAGVTVKQTTGLPGKPFSIQVRGTGSISAGNEPLYVIDGFPLATTVTNGAGNFAIGSPLDNINPNDIENIEVLKDAAAAAIYGSRASNGVVLITTKHGKGGAPKINFNTYLGYNQASRKLQMLDGQQWIDRATEIINGNYVAAYGSKGATANDTYAQRLAITGAFAAGNFLDPRWTQPGHPGLEFIDWQDQIFRKGLMSNQEISASGATDAVSYFISGNYTNQNGFVINNGFKSYSARANVDVKIAKNLKVGLNIAPTYSVTEDPGIEGKDNIYHQSLSMSPVQEDTVGNLANIGKNAQYAWSNTTNSPVGKLTYNVGETKKYRTIATIYGEYEIIKGLTLRSSLNLDNTDNNTASYQSYLTVQGLPQRTFDPTKPALSTLDGGQFSSYKRQTFVNENTLSYNTVIHTDHNLSLLVGQSYNFNRTDNFGVTAVGGFANNAVQTISGANGIQFSGTNGSTEDVLISYFSRVQYSYKDKYLLSASLRADGSSRFGSNNQYGVFPSASLGWRIIQEKFMKPLTALSDLKLRVSYGVNGTNNLGGDYNAIPTLIASTSAPNYVFGATPAAALGQAPARIANPDLQWERSQTYDGGIDFGFFNNRITGSLDYYNKLNTQLLLNVQVPEVTGFQTYLSNAGSVRNIGEELELTTRNLVGKFEWNTTINISHNTNKVVALAGNQTQILVPSAFDISDFILKVGQPMNSIFVIKQNGELTAADIANKAAVFGTETVGDPKYEDINGDGVIDANDRQIVGHPNPDYIWGVTNTFKFKGFDLSVLVQGQNGGSIYSLLGRALTRTGQGFTDNAPYFYTQRWESPDNPGEGRVSKAYSTFGRIVNTDWLYSSDYIRVRDITLGYNLKSIIKSPVISGARIYVTAENFFGHDKYYGGANPDATNTDLSGNANYLSPGDYGGLPIAKSLIFGLSVTF